MDIITTGGEVPATNGKAPTAAHSIDSAKNVKPHTTKTAKLTPDMALEILEASLIKCQDSGIGIGITSFYRDGSHCVAIVIDGCEVDSERHLQVK